MQPNQPNDQQEQANKLSLESSNQPSQLPNNNLKIIIIIWLLAWPLMLLCAMFILVLPNNDQLTTPLAVLLFIELLLFIYGLLGWIPVLLIRKKQRKV